MTTATVNAASPARRHAITARERLLITLFAAAVLLPGVFSTSLTDRDEGWYAQVSREMLATGDWLVPRYLGAPWLGKPPLLYWCTAASFAVFGLQAWAGRLVSVLASVGVAHLLASFGVELGNRRVAWLAVLGYLTAALPVFVGKLLITDALLLFWTTAAMLLLWRSITRGPTWHRGVLMWGCVGLGILTKGPTIAIFLVGFGVGLLACREYRRRLFTPPLLLTLPLALLLALPWYLYIDHAAGGTLREQFVGYEILSRFTAPPHGHVGPPGYYVLVLLLGWLPWTVLLPGAVGETWQRRRRDPAARLLLLWFAVPWLVLELIPGKLPHYVLPCCVPLAIMFGRLWDAGLERPVTIGQRAALVLWVLLPALVGAALLAAGLASADFDVRRGFVAAGAMLAVGFLLTGWFAVRGDLPRAFGGAIGATLMFHAVLGWGLLPALEPHRLSRNVAELANHAAAADSAVITAGYDEPTMFFYLDRPATVRHRDGLPAVLRERRDAVVIARDTWLADLGFDPAAVDSPWRHIRGFNYAKGERVTLWVRPPVR